MVTTAQAAEIKRLFAQPETSERNAQINALARGYTPGQTYTEKQGNTTVSIVVPATTTTSTTPTTTTTPKVTTPTVTTPVATTPITTVAKTTTPAPITLTSTVASTPLGKILTKLGTAVTPTLESKEVLEKAAEAPKVYTQAGAISWAKDQLAKEAAATTTTEPSSGRIGLTTVATPVVTTPAPAAPTETRKSISGEIMGDRKFTVIQVKPVTGDVYYTVEEGGKTVSGFENVIDSGSIHWKLGKAVYGEKYGEPSKTTVEPKDVNLVTYFDTTKIPVSADTLSKYEKYLPTKDVPLVIQSPSKAGTTATPTELGATVVIPGEKPSEAQAAFIEKVTTFEKKEEPHRTEMALEKEYYVGREDTGEAIYTKESPYQVLHDYNPATQDVSQQQLYSQLESDFGSELDVATKNIEIATEATKNIPVAEDYLHQLNLAIEDVNKAGERDDIFLVENGVEVKYSKQEALNKLSSQLEVRPEYLNWKAGKTEKMSDDNLTAAEYLDWAKTTSEKLPEYQSGLHYVSTQKFTASKYKELGYKVNVTDEGYSFELPSSTEVYQWKHGEMTGAALSTAAFLESPLAIKTVGSAIQKAITGDQKVGEARIEELSTYALGLDVAIKEGDYAMHVLASPAVVEGIVLPVATLGATSLIAEGLNVAAPRIVSGLSNVGSKLTPEGQAIVGKLTTGAKTVAEPFVTVGKKVVEVGSKLPSTALTREVSGQALNWGAFGVMEGGKLVEVAVKEPEKFGGVLAESAFTWGITTSAMGEGLKNLDIKMPEFKSTPAMAELKEGAELRNWAFKGKIEAKFKPVEEVLGDVKYAMKSRELEEPVLRDLSAGIQKAGAKVERFGERVDYKFGEFKKDVSGQIEKVSAKVEVPIVKAREAGAEFKAEIKDTFYEKVPLTRDIKTKVEEFKFREAEAPTSEFAPAAVKTKQTTVEPFGKQYKIVETKPKVFEVTEKPKEVIKYPAEGKGLEGTKPFEFKEAKPEVREVPSAKYSKEEELRLEAEYTKQQEAVSAKMQEWGGEMKGLPPEVEKPKLMQEQLYPTKKPDVFVAEKITVTPKVKEGKLGIETEFKAPESRPLTIEEVNERMRLRQEADIKKGIKAKPTEQKVFSKEVTDTGKKSYILTSEGKKVEVTRLEDVGKDITGKGKTPLKFTKEDVAKLKGERGTGEDTGLLLEEKPKVEIKAKPYEPLVLKEAEEVVTREGFDTSYLYTMVPAKYLVDIEQGIGGTSEHWTGVKPEPDRVFRRDTTGARVEISEQELGTELDLGRISPEITDTITENDEDILDIGITDLGGGTKLEQRLGLDVGSVLEQQLEQKLMLEGRTILDVSPTTGRLPGKPYRPIWVPKGRRTGQDEEEVLFGKKKKKKAAAKTRPGRKDILADIISVTRSQARYGKATHPKMSKKVYEEAARTGFRHIPTTELKTKQYTPRVKSNGLRLDSNKLMVGNLKTKVNIRRGKRNAPRKKRWI